MKCAHCTYQSRHPDPVVAARNVAIHAKRAHPEIQSGNDRKRARRVELAAAQMAPSCQVCGVRHLKGHCSTRSSE